ncbi:DNA methyltransferase [Rhodococcus sp. 3Y1]
MGATLFARENLSVLGGAKLPNNSFLAAIKALAEIDDPATGTPRPVDYRNLDSEELGGMYEGLLAFTPRYDAAARTFSLEIAAGNDRKKSGSYTPSDLIALVLDEALNPLIDEAMRTPDPEAALLALTVVDPAVGSGHFVVAAARRLAAAVATVRTGDTEPNPIDLRAATADVIERCIYGVDLNDLAIEITKVALWLEAFDAQRPFRSSTHTSRSATHSSAPPRNCCATTSPTQHSLLSATTTNNGPANSKPATKPNAPRTRTS